MFLEQAASLFAITSDIELFVPLIRDIEIQNKTESVTRIYIFTYDVHIIGKKLLYIQGTLICQQFTMKNILLIC